LVSPALNLGCGRGLAGKRNPLKSQLAALFFHSSSDESREEQDQELDQGKGKGNKAIYINQRHGFFQERNQIEDSPPLN